MRKMIIAGIAGLSSLALFGPAAPASASTSASSCGAYCFGAIALGDNNGAGIAVGRPYSSAANNAALNECEARTTGCRVVVAFENEWGALATSPNGAAGWSYGTTGSGAESAALRGCVNAGGYDCRISLVGYA